MHPSATRPLPFSANPTVVDPSQLCSKILEACRNASNGIGSDALSTLLFSQGYTNEQQVQALNLLLQNGRLAVCQSPTIGLIYKEIDAVTAGRFTGLSAEERLVYQLIEQSGDMGVWTKDLRIRSNLKLIQLTKYIKILESRKLIKSIKSVQAKNKKVYMLFNIEPNREVTGGAWYTESEFDEEFIELLEKQCFSYIQLGPITTHQLHQKITQSQISRVELRLEDIQSIVDILLYDGVIEEASPPTTSFNPSSSTPSSTSSSPIHYISCSLPLMRTALTSTPCGVCPVADECSPSGLISPLTCLYLKQWLD